MDLETLKKAVAEKIDRYFAGIAKEVTVGYGNLALNAADEDVRRKASERIMDHFNKQRMPGTPFGAQVFIQNNIPMPEVAMRNGKPVNILEAGDVKILSTEIYDRRSPMTSGKKILPEPKPQPKKLEVYAKRSDIDVTKKPEPVKQGPSEQIFDNEIKK